MKIDVGLIEFDVKKGWDRRAHRTVYAVRASHPVDPRVLGHGTGHTQDEACARAQSNLLSLLIRGGGQS